VAATQVIVLNGGSSSGKTTVARKLQALLPDPWLLLGVDDLVDALPPEGGGIVFGDDGSVEVGERFRELESAWTGGIAAMAHAGARVIIDDVFLGGAASQERTRAQLAGLSVLWVGVRCHPVVAAERERARGDRAPGMAARQATTVHEGVAYDLEVDTTHTAPETCAAAIVARIARG
jgi:chloramphenicol 3-O phosphotransferase